MTSVFRGMPTVGRGRHRLLFGWRIFLQALPPGRQTVEAMARGTPAPLTAWRCGRVRPAADGNVPLLVRGLAQARMAT